MVVGVVLLVIGSIDRARSSPPKIHTGNTYVKSAIVLYAATFLALVVIACLTRLHLAAIPAEDEGLLTATLGTLPFFTIRIAYSVVTVFSPTSVVFSTTSTQSTAIITQGLMSLAAEAVIVVVFLKAGWAVPVARMTPTIYRRQVEMAVEAGNGLSSQALQRREEDDIEQIPKVNGHMVLRSQRTG
jgi:hypothetical protein